jgi:hypothetical protein
VIDMGPGPALSQPTIDGIDFDTHNHVPSPVHGTYGAALPFSLGIVINALLPFFIKALEALIASGITQPTPVQIVAKCSELAAADSTP